MKSLGQSLIYNTLVKTPGLTNAIASIDPDRDSIPLSSLQSTIMMINNKLNMPTKMAVVKLMQEGKIKIIYNPAKIKTPKYFDTFGKVHMGKPVFIVNIGRYARGSEGNLEMNARTLFSMFQTAVIYNTMLERWDTIVNNDMVKKAGCTVYSKLAAKVLVKLYAIDNDRMKSDFVRFMLAKFYLKSVCDLKLDEKTLNDTAYHACVSKSTLVYLVNMENNIVMDKGEDLYDNLETLFKGMRQIQGLKNLSLRSFAENWARMYGEGSVLAIDYLPAFLSMCSSVVVAGNLVKDAVFMNVCEKEIVELYSALSRML